MIVQISVIVPVYNTEKYIRSALDSLLAQTVKFYEIIVINDGSTDSSYEILKEYESAGRIKLFSQNNQGQGAARNKGVKFAQGNYIYFFDSDDMASPELVETIERKFKACNNLDLVAFAGDVFLDNDCKKIDWSPSYNRPIFGKYKNFFDASVAMDSFHSNYCSPCLFVIKKAVIEKNDFHFHFYFHEDEAFLLDMIASVGYCQILDDKLFIRRIRIGSTMTSKKNISHVKGYLYASDVAKNYSLKSNSVAYKDYFSKRSLQYYLKAITISYEVDDLNLYNSVYKRIAGLPTWKLSFRQLVYLLLGKKEEFLRNQLIKLRQSRVV